MSEVTAEAKVTLIPVAPVGTDTMLAFVDSFNEDGTHRSGDIRPVSVGRYPESPKGRELRRKRIEAWLTIRDMAPLLGIGVADYSGVETGRFTLSDGDWGKAFGVLGKR